MRERFREQYGDAGSLGLWVGGGQAWGSVPWLPGGICLAADGGTKKLLLGP